VGEGRRVIGNIERVSALFLTKTVYSVLLALLVGLPGLLGHPAMPYPFLPRHVTIVGWFTIGLPAFVLSLAPNNDRARAGFVARVLWLAVPAGIVIGAACFVSYAVAGHGHGTDHAERVRVSTTALITLIVLALWVLGIVMRPLRPWKVGLFGLMVVLSAAMFSTRFTRDIFQLDPSGPGDAALAFGCAAVGVVVIELLSRSPVLRRSR
jgi:cation-transporting ATPase E